MIFLHLGLSVGRWIIHQYIFEMTCRLFSSCASKSLSVFLLSLYLYPQLGCKPKKMVVKEHESLCSVAVTAVVYCGYS